MVKAKGVSEITTHHFNNKKTNKYKYMHLCSIGDVINYLVNKYVSWYVIVNIYTNF